MDQRGRQLKLPERQVVVVGNSVSCRKRPAKGSGRGCGLAG